MNRPYYFIIALFGNRHRKTLLPLIYSITISNPEAGIAVFWEEIDAKFIESIKKVFRQTEFIETSFHFGEDITRRISSKTAMWEFAIRQKSGENLIFLDADTLVIKNIAQYFEDLRPDIIFTVDHKNQFPINTGVILARANTETQLFFHSWLNETQLILKSPELYKMANNKKLSYGGADQMSFQRLIEFEKNKNDYKYGNLIISGVPREQLNETNSAPITKNTHIIHFKGGWYNILFNGYGFGGHRLKKTSWEMYIFYLNCYKEALSYAKKKLGEINASYFVLPIPFYLNPRSLKERKGAYSVYRIFIFIKFLPSRIKKFILEKIR